MRRDGRTDANQGEIVQDLRDVGASVFVTSGVGSGFPDIVVGFRGETYLIEIKDGNKSASRHRLTKAEQKFHDTWNGQVDVAKNTDEALEIIGAI